MKKKKNKRKKWCWLKWMLTLPLLLTLLFFGLHSMKSERWDHEKHKKAEYAISHDKERQAFQTKKEDFAGFERHTHHEKHHEKRFDDLFFVPFLLELVLVLFGWLILRKSEGNMAKKWTGILLLIIGLLPLLPILALAAMIVWAYKKFKQKRTVTSEYINTDMYNVSTMQKQIDILDQWERNIRKEEK
ncbi:hypothetical protein [Bacillus cereus group sp. BfR-BA-01380]|uniref:hypothetical protein n=1 Tax=Bacillus cereus group sp. BfR-BA-01380 TaxID=2920324 RepID=UPI001F5670CB|nr:hypothetical protein [Bacillus cereus group sp. BfR-BA-01380]